MLWLSLSILGLFPCGQIISRAPQGFPAETSCGGLLLIVCVCMCGRQREIDVTPATSADDRRNGKEREKRWNQPIAYRDPVDGLKRSAAKSNAA